MAIYTWASDGNGSGLTNEVATRVLVLQDSQRPTRLTIVSFSPSVKSGAYPAKRVAGDWVELSAVVLCDQQMVLDVSVRHLHPDGTVTEHQLRQPPDQIGGPLYRGGLRFAEVGRHELTAQAWIDHRATLQSRVDRKLAAGVDAALDVVELDEIARQEHITGSRAISDHHSEGPFAVVVDRPVAAFGAWYEFFPRSTVNPPVGSVATHHGTLSEAIGRLDYIAELGFDVVYIPPVHPIGQSYRKGPNGTERAGPDDVGSPWAIGSSAGGHHDVHPALGSHRDIAALVDACRERGLELALDIAFQCSPDHPWVGQHPEWFQVRSDGSIAYAENPPKLYQDIVPLAFDTPAWHSLWQALADVFRTWMNLGVRIFRVDNPHTKPLAFWQWAIAELKREDPGLVFLAEAFSHPEMMLELSRVGFSQSYTHFPWQHSPWQLHDYYELLAVDDNREHFRGAAWPNTPDILTEELQQGVPQVFAARLVLAATLNATYGIYGPAFELQESRPRHAGSEEYLDSEKYQLRSWDLHEAHTLAPLVRLLNTIRRSHLALQNDRTLHFHDADNPRILVYSKTAPAGRPEQPPAQPSHQPPAEPSHQPPAEPIGTSTAPVVVVVNTDYWNVQQGLVHLDLDAVGIRSGHEIEARDMLTGTTYRWASGDVFVRLDPWQQPAHVFELRSIPGDGPAHQ
ncbi:MAG: maltotransferase domain-containing protein [Ilumatobacteraceae bacterium]